MDEKLYPMIFKRKSFHRFKDAGVICQEEVNRIAEAFRRCRPLVPGIRTEMRIVPGSQTTCNRGQEYCLLFYSEKKDGYLPNIGYIGEQLDLLMASWDIGALWFGIGRTEVQSPSGLDFVIMIAIAKMEPGRFRKDMFKSKRKPPEEIWFGKDDWGIADLVRFAPSACNTQPWIVEREGQALRICRYQKPGKRGIMPADKVEYYNRIDIGIFLLFLEVCLNHHQIGFDRVLCEDPQDAEKTLTAVYTITERTRGSDAYGNSGT
ncbi:MAG: nitroreductase family protein [Faecousia sp.]